jgi:hypothetical protein
MSVKVVVSKAIPCGPENGLQDDLVGVLVPENEAEELLIKDDFSSILDQKGAEVDSKEIISIYFFVD